MVFKLFVVSNMCLKMKCMASWAGGLKRTLRREISGGEFPKLRHGMLILWSCARKKIIMVQRSNQGQGLNAQF